MTPHAQWDALMALHEKSTPGEWFINHHGDVRVRVDDETDADAGIYPLDTAFIVAAHNLLPALAAEYRRMRDALEWYADPANNGKQRWQQIDQVSVPVRREIDDDEGEVARDALRGAKGESK
jgi:hypothetical protein